MVKTRETRPASPHGGRVLKSLPRWVKDAWIASPFSDPKDLTFDQNIKAIQKELRRTRNQANRRIYLTGLASAFQVRFYDASTDLEADVNQWVKYAQELLDVSDTTNREIALEHLASGLFNRYLRLHQLDDLDRSIHCGQEVVQNSRNDVHPTVRCLRYLSQGLGTRFQRLHRTSDLEQSILYAQQAIDKSPVGSIDEQLYLRNLGNSLRCRYVKSGQLSDLEASIQCARGALNVAPPGHSRRAKCFEFLGERLADRYNKTRSTADLENSIQFYLQALDVAPEEDTDRPSYMYNLAEGHKSRYNKFGQLEDLEQFIRYAERAVDTAGATSLPNKPVYLATAATGYFIRYERLNQIPDLQKSVHYAQNALDTSPANHPRRAQFLVGLSVRLRARAKRLNRPEDLAQGIRLAQDAVDMTARDDPKRASYLSRLGSAYFESFQRLAQITDLDYCIETVQSAISTSADRGTKGCKFYLVQLGEGLRARFNVSQKLTDLEQSTKCIQEAAIFFSADDPERASVLGSLGRTYLKRFYVSNQTADLDQAIQTLQSALEAVPTNHINRAESLLILATTLKDRFKTSTNTDDIEKSLQYCHEALRITDLNHDEQRRKCFQHLGDFYRYRFHGIREISDLGHSVRYTQEALQLATSDDPARPMLLLHSGTSYRLLFEKYQSNQDLDRSNNALEEAVEICKLPSLSLVCRLYLVFNCISTDSWEPAASLIDKIIVILPDVIPPSLSRDDAQNLLRKLGEALSILPTIYLNAGRSPMRTLEAMENFRGLIASLTLDAKSDEFLLKEQHPELYNQYNQCRGQIASLGLDSTVALEVDDTQSYLARRQQLQYLHEQLRSLRNEIREYPGFEQFLLPPKGNGITDLAIDGPIVCFNINEWGSHAFLVTTSGVKVISLPNFDHFDIKDTVTILNPRHDPEKRDAQIIDSDDEVEIVAEQSKKLLHLWDNAVKPVLQELGVLRKPSSIDELPRLWWVGAGIMSLMPLHAAGTHIAGSMENTLSHVLSSYAPTLKMLQYLRSKPPLSLNVRSRELLVVSMETTPGIYGSLNTADEVTAIEKHSQGLAVVRHLAQPMKRDVIEALQSCALAHFACHGSVNPAEPAKSSLVLGKGKEENLTVDEMMDAVTHTGAQIAYLSACSTAEIKARDLIHESIHLASAFQLAGFQHVIGTLWRADDNTAVAVAGKFYELLFQEKNITDAIVAYSLHNAVLHYRRTHGSNAEVVKWAAFIHMGC